MLPPAPGAACEGASAGQRASRLDQTGGVSGAVRVTLRSTPM